MTRLAVSQCAVKVKELATRKASAASRPACSPSAIRAISSRSRPSITPANWARADGSTSSMVTPGTKPTAPPALLTSVQQATISARSCSVSFGSTSNSSFMRIATSGFMRTILA